MEFIDRLKVPYNTIHANNFEFYEGARLPALLSAGRDLNDGRPVGFEVEERGILLL